MLNGSRSSKFRIEPLFNIHNFLDLFEYLKILCLFYFNFSFICKGIFPTYASSSASYHPLKTRRRRQRHSLCNWIYRLLQAIMWVLKIQPRFSNKAASALKH